MKATRGGDVCLTEAATSSSVVTDREKWPSALFSLPTSPPGPVNRVWDKQSPALPTSQPKGLSRHVNDLWPTESVLRWHFAAQLSEDRCSGDRCRQLHAGGSVPRRGPGGYLVAQQGGHQYLPGWGAAAPGHVGDQDRSPRRDPRRIQADCDQRPRHSDW